MIGISEVENKQQIMFVLHKLFHKWVIKMYQSYEVVTFRICINDEPVEAVDADRGSGRILANMCLTVLFIGMFTLRSCV